MVRTFFVPMLSLLATAGVVLGQPPVVQFSSQQPVPQLLHPNGGEVLPPPGVYVENTPPGPASWLGGEPLAPLPASCAPGVQQMTGIFTTNIEYLFWFIERDEVAFPLYSTNPNLSPVPLNLGAGGTDFSTRLEFQNRPLSGARLTAGYWFTADLDPVLETNPLFRAVGVEVSGFFLAERSIQFREDSSAVLLRPFIDFNNRAGSALLVAAPGVATGTIFGSATVDLWGIEANGWKTVYANPPGQSVRVDVMAGFRYLNFDSELNIHSQSLYADVQTIPELVPFAGNRFDVTDSFRTGNDFFGAQVGFSLNYITPCIMASTTIKFGVGDTHQQIRVAGQQVRTAASGATTTTEGGLLAQPTNIGSFDRHRISLVPEVNFKLAFPLGRHFTFFAGYTLMGWSNVVRPGSQVDPVLDITQIPNFPTGGAAPTGFARPAVPFRDEFLFIHGLNTGLMVIW